MRNRQSPWRNWTSRDYVRHARKQLVHAAGCTHRNPPCAAVRDVFYIADQYERLCAEAKVVPRIPRSLRHLATGPWDDGEEF